ncbi:hypothetical protein ASG31_07890 [Chryseobacterium sp. Leaf404]|uniref:hypothetical protein n=1 Tax=unclassified Chryseobacterium TaxID=2593645 RepID=UPI0006FC393E|nr:MULTISPECIES: hypothetical protein [unclassified Chryseobacterium]KQT17325.1 hypothetical protein ASG31_07890 [Chryseobacterium sp. Leaf404]
MDKNILKQLKSDYEDLVIKPSANLWNQIDNGLESGSETGKKPTFRWWKYAAVILFLISVGSLFYFNSNKPIENDKIIVKKFPYENHLKPTEKFETVISSKEKFENSIISFKKNQNVSSEKIYKTPTEFIEPTEIIVFNKKTDEIIAQNPTLQNSEFAGLKPSKTESKKSSYINADDLLLGRELDKTRVEMKNDRQFGVVDASKLKFKRPSSLQIFGVHVFADSIVSE